MSINHIQKNVRTVAKYLNRTAAAEWPYQVKRALVILAALDGDVVVDGVLEIYADRARDATDYINVAIEFLQTPPAKKDQH